MNQKEIHVRYLETTGRCNLNCPVCVERYRNFHMDQHDFLSIAEANTDIFRNEWAWFDFSGEPLLDPLFFDRAWYMIDHLGMQVRISTNALLLTEENCRKLVEIGISYLVISVTTLNSRHYRDLRGVDALEQVLENTKRMKRIADEAGSPMLLQAVAIDTGENDLEEFLAYFHDLGMLVGVHQFTHRARRVRKTYDVAHLDIPRRGVCLGREQNIGILCNCDVVTCCCDFQGRNTLGNLRDYHYSVRELVDNGALERMFQNQKRGIYTGACADCGDWIYFQEDSHEKYVTVYAPGQNLVNDRYHGGKGI